MRVSVVDWFKFVVSQLRSVSILRWGNPLAISDVFCWEIFNHLWSSNRNEFCSKALGMKLFSQPFNSYIFSSNHSGSGIWNYFLSSRDDWNFISCFMLAMNAQANISTIEASSSYVTVSNVEFRLFRLEVWNYFWLVIPALEAYLTCRPNSRFNFCPTVLYFL